MEKLSISERFACAVLGHHRSTQRKNPHGRPDEEALTADIIRLDSRSGPYDYRRVAAMLRSEGWTVNAKRVERIWWREGMKVFPRSKERPDQTGKPLGWIQLLRGGEGGTGSRFGGHQEALGRSVRHADAALRLDGTSCRWRGGVQPTRGSALGGEETGAFAPVCSLVMPSRVDGRLYHSLYLAAVDRSRSVKS